MANELLERVRSHWMNALGGQELAPRKPPKTLMLELTNSCNLRCVMCANPKMRRKRGLMPLPMAKEAISQAVEFGIAELALYSTGESLIHPKFLDFVQLAGQAGLPCYVTSNGLLLDAKFCLDLCHSGLRSFKFSVDGGNAPEYEAIRRGGKFSKLMENLQLLNQARRESGSGLKIYMGLIDPGNDPRFRQACEERYGHLVDALLWSPMVNHGGLTESEVQGLRGALSADLDKPPCRLLWDRLVLAFDGRFCACCVDFELEMAYARFPETSLRQAWHHPQLQAFRLAHRRGDLSALHLCRSCDGPMLQQVELLDQLNGVPV
jgi:hypothetical protein